jgi:hypothetical protein
MESDCKGHVEMQQNTLNEQLQTCKTVESNDSDDAATRQCEPKMERSISQKKPFMAYLKQAQARGMIPRGPKSPGQDLHASNQCFKRTNPRQPATIHLITRAAGGDDGSLLLLDW